MSAYLRVHNSGNEGKALFRDSSDYDTFISFIAEYLSPKQDLNNYKKTFTVQGKTYSGVPHLPKNFNHKVELLSFAISGNEFNFVLKEIEAGSVTSFIRSICTRYAIYYNKKYQNKGSIFSTPYKFEALENSESVNLAVNELHKIDGFTSREMYQSNNLPNWIVSDVQTNSLLPKEEIKVEPIIVQNISDTNKVQHNKSVYAYAIVGFLILLNISLRNIYVEQMNVLKAQQNNNPVNTLAIEKDDDSLNPQVLSYSTTSEDTNHEPENSNNNTTSQFVKINEIDYVSEVNVYGSNSIDANIIAIIKPNEIYESIFNDGNWYQIKLPDGTLGFVESYYIKVN